MLAKLASVFKSKRVVGKTTIEKEIDHVIYNIKNNPVYLNDPLIMYVVFMSPYMMYYELIDAIRQCGSSQTVFIPQNNNAVELSYFLDKNINNLNLIIINYEKHIANNSSVAIHIKDKINTIMYELLTSVNNAVE